MNVTACIVDIQTLELEINVHVIVCIVHMTLAQGMRTYLLVHRTEDTGPGSLFPRHQHNQQPSCRNKAQACYVRLTKVGSQHTDLLEHLHRHTSVIFFWNLGTGMSILKWSLTVTSSTSISSTSKRSMSASLMGSGRKKSSSLAMPGR